MYPVQRTPRGIATFLLFLLVLAGMGPVSALTYTVKKGDTLYAISKRYKTTAAKLMSANGIKDPTKLRIGQRLKISSSSSSSSSRKTTSTKKRVPQVGRGKRVIIDPGHGGRDFGAYKGGVKESYLNMRVAQKLEYYLRQRGYSTSMTRRSDTFISLSRRAAIANSYRNAVFVSIHFNSTRSTRVRGVETFYAGSAGRSLATSIQREMVRRCKARNRGVRFARFTVLVQTRCPAVLVECGFMSNPSERSRCKTSSYQTQAALAIADGIGKYRWR